MKLLFCVNLIFSFPLTMVPTFSAIEAVVLGQRETGTEDAESEAQSDIGISNADPDNSIQQQ